MRLSICMQVHNEEKTIADCLSCLGFADEIVIALDKTTDNSKNIAEKFNAVVIEGNWLLEGDRRNAAFERATGDWVLEVDCDERITPELGAEIRRVIDSSTSQLHCIPFDNYIGDRLVRYGWGAYIGVQAKIALFRKGAKIHEKDGRIAHPIPVINGEFGPMLQNRIIHYIDTDLTDTVRRFNNYTTAGAYDLIKNGNIGSFGRNFLRFFSRFYKSYIRRHGYREGDIGFFIAVLAGLYPLVSYLKAKYQK